MPAFDPRVTPARADLAAKHLEGKVKAARYVEGRVYEVIEPQAPLRREPRPDAPLDTEALKGERVTIYDTNGEGWAWGQLGVRRLCRLAAGQRAGAARCGADPQGDGAAHAGRFPVRRSSCRRSKRCRSARGSPSRASRIAWR